MVLMTVGQKNPPHFFPILHHIGKIGDNQIDAGHIVVREGKSAVNNDNILLRLDHRHVFADLPEAAERDDANRIFRFCSALAGTASDFLGSGRLRRGNLRGGGLRRFLNRRRFFSRPSAPLRRLGRLLRLLSFLDHLDRLRSRRLSAASFLRMFRRFHRSFSLLFLREKLGDAADQPIRIQLDPPVQARFAQDSRFRLLALRIGRTLGTPREKTSSPGSVFIIFWHEITLQI